MPKDKSVHLPERELESYEDASKDALKSIKITLSATPGDITTINVDTDIKGFRLYPQVSNIRFAVNEEVEAVTTTSSTTIEIANLAIGDIAKADQFETRLIEATNGGERYITILSSIASAVVEFTTF